MHGVIETRPPGAGLRRPIRELIPVDSLIISTKRIILLKTPLIGSDQVCLNGIEWINDSSCDYTLSGNIIIINPVWQLYIGDTFSIRYIEG